MEEARGPRSTYLADPVKLDRALLDITLELDRYAKRLMVLKRSASAEIKLVADSLDYPEVVCTRDLKRSITTYGKKKLGPVLTKPLSDLIEKIESISERRITRAEREAIKFLCSAYRKYITAVCESEGENRIKLLKGYARLYGLSQVWLVEQSTALIMASINEFNESQQTNSHGASAVSQISGAHIKRERINPLFPGKEAAVDLFGNRLFRQGTAATRLLKLAGVLVRSVASEVNKGSKALNRLNELKGSGKSTIKIFRDNPKLEASLKFQETRETHLLQASQTIEGPLLLDYLHKGDYLHLDNESTSIHFVLTLLLCRSDDRADNSAVDQEQRVVCFDNDRALGPPVGIKHGHPYLNLRSIFLLFSKWNDQPLEKTVLSSLQNLEPAHFILNWLGDLRNRNMRYNSLEEAGWLTASECEKLSLPICLPKSSISEISRSLLKLKEIALQNPNSRWAFFEGLYPPIADLYQKLLAQVDNDPIKAQELLFPRGSECWLELLVDRNNPIFGEISAYAVDESKGEPCTPIELVEHWFTTLSLNTRSKREQIHLIQNALFTFPELEKLTLLRTTLEGSELKDLIQNSGHLKKVTLIDAVGLTLNGILGILQLGVTMTIVGGKFEPEKIKIAKDCALQHGCFVQFKEPPENIEKEVIENGKGIKERQADEFDRREWVRPLKKATLSPSRRVLRRQRMGEAKRIPYMKRSISTLDVERILTLKTSKDLCELETVYQVKVDEKFAADQQLLEQLAEKLPGTNLLLLDLAGTTISDNELDRLIKAMPEDPIFFDIRGCSKLTDNGITNLIAAYEASGKEGNPYGQLCMGHLYYFCIKTKKRDIASASAHYRKSANQGLAEAIFYLGHCLRIGSDRVPGDPVEAARLYHAAAEKNHAKSQYHLGLCYVRNEGVPKSIKTAVRYFLLAAAKGNPDACSALARRYETGDGVDKDLKEAERYRERAAEQGDDDAKRALEEFQRKRPVSFSLKSPRRWRENSLGAKELNSNAHKECDNVYLIQSKQDLDDVRDAVELKVTSSFARDENLLLQLANQLPAANALCQVDFSNSEITDAGLEIIVKAIGENPIFIDLRGCKLTSASVDLLRAKYVHCAVNGRSKGWLFLGKMYFLGSGVNKNHASAIKFYLKAAEAGVAEAQYLLGNCHAGGLGVEKLEERALYYYGLAAGQEYPDALCALGNYYMNAEGSDRDQEKAMKFLQRAADLGNEGAIAIIRSRQGSPRPSFGKSTGDKKLRESKDGENSHRFSLSPRGKSFKWPVKSVRVGGRKKEEFPTSKMSEQVLHLRSSADLDRLREVFKVKVSQVFAEDSDLLSQLAEKLPCSLRVLDLSHTEISDVGLRVLIKKMPESLVYFDVKGCKQLTEKAKKSLASVYHRAAKRRDPVGQRCFGLLRMYGLGVKKNEKKALDWFRSAQKGLDTWAGDLIGDCYMNARGGVPFNPRQAVVFYEFAATKGMANAQCHLAEVLWSGEELDKSEPERAVALYKLAAQQGHARAQYLLGRLYLDEGEGGVPDPEKAKPLIEAAARQGHKAAKTVLDDWQ